MQVHRLGGPQFDVAMSRLGRINAKKLTGGAHGGRRGGREGDGAVLHVAREGGKVEECRRGDFRFRCRIAGILPAWQHGDSPARCRRSDLGDLGFRIVHRGSSHRSPYTSRNPPCARVNGSSGSPRSNRRVKRAATAPVGGSGVQKRWVS